MLAKQRFWCTCLPALNQRLDSAGETIFKAGTTGYIVEFYAGHVRNSLLRPRYMRPGHVTCNTGGVLAWKAAVLQQEHPTCLRFSQCLTSTGKSQMFFLLGCHTQAPYARPSGIYGFR